MKKAIIIGASSGIGKELARVLVRKGFILGITARRLSKLNELYDEFPGRVTVKKMDVTEPTSAMATLTELINEMGGLDLLVISSGVGSLNKELDWSLEYKSMATNVVGFVAITNVAMQHFLKERSGHLVGISSIAALRGIRDAPAYSASKAYISNYMGGLRQKMIHDKYPITITDVQPGFVNTRMAKGDNLFWVTPVEKAAEQIYQAITKKKSHVYISRRWRLIAWLLKILPGAIYNRL